MNCPRCQHANPPTAKFCEECGTRIVLTCARCGSELGPTARFCAGCGEPVAAAAAREPAPASPGTYTPRHLAERILTTKSAIEGERKQVTVLFCDVAGWTSLGERVDPEILHEIMDEILRLMADAVHRYDGTVNQYLGDGLMALFGAPLALEDHALRGVQAALTIQETFRGYGEQLARERGIELHVRLGLNTGLVVVGKIGDDLRMDYTAVGDTTNLAARMQQAAEPDTILVTDATHRLVEGFVRSEPVGPLAVKGHREPVITHRVTGRRSGRSRFDVSAERGLTPLVGRRRELDLMRERLDRVIEGPGQVVGIIGEPGVGKSRLLHEFRQSLAGRADVIWLDGQCVTYRQSTPYFPVLGVVRRSFRIEEDDNPFQVAGKLRAGVLALDPALESALPFLADVFGLPVVDDAVRHLEPQVKRRRTFEAISTLTAAASRRRPIVIAIEDLHWIDRTSEDYLAFFVETLERARVLLITTQRPGHVVRWADSACYTQVALDFLTPDESRAMLAGLLGVERLSDDLVRVVRNKAEGNPLFVEEITRSLLERGTLVRGEEGIRWTGAASLDLPATVQDIIRARIDSLDDPVKRTMQTASAIGREFGVRLLSHVARTERAVPAFLDRLQRLDLIHATRFFPELEYIFKHAVVQDVAYQSLLARRRQELHALIAAALEELYPDRLDEHAGVLAFHWARSAEPARAIPHALVAGDRAARLHANAEAAQFYEQALGIARALPPSPDSRGQQIDATVRLAAVGVTRQDIERDRTNLENARALAEELADERRLAQVLYWLGRLHYVLYDPPTAIALATRSLELADRLGADDLAAAPANLLGRAYWQRSEFVRASEMLVRSAEVMRRLGNRTEEATAAGFAGNVLGLMGEWSRAFAHLDHGVELSRSIKNPFAEAAACFYRGIIRDQRGEWTLAAEDWERATRAAERASDVFRLYLVKLWEGRTRTMAGDPARGKALLDESLALADRIGTKFGLAWLRVFLAETHLALGELEAALGAAEEGIRLAAQGGDRWLSGIGQRVLADVLLRRTPPDTERGRAAVAEAIAIHEALGARPELARDELMSAVVLQRSGREAEAAEARARGQRLLDALQMERPA